jgi:UDPglucose 6-dehydrogenase
MKITIIGTGYVGLTTAVALAFLGHNVQCIDQNRALIKNLQKGHAPIHEPGLEELLSYGLPLSFATWDCFEQEADFYFIAVGTPSQDNGAADLTYVENAALQISSHIGKTASLHVVIKSTVPLGTNKRIYDLINLELQKRNHATVLTVSSNPEFLREGSALYDTFYPDRIVLGVNNPLVLDQLELLYAPILEQNFTLPYQIAYLPKDKLPSLVITTPISAELIKYASNAFLATKISFINEFATLAELVGADIVEVARGVGLDERIGRKYLRAGVGWGGSCLGKDIKAILQTAKTFNYEMNLLKAALKVNRLQRESIIKKLEQQLPVLEGSQIGILGISFKPDTDDVRDAPFIHIARRLIELGARVKAHDPAAISTCSRNHPDLPVTYCNTPEEAVTGSNALVLLTEWELYRKLDYSTLGGKMKQKIIIDGRNALDSKALQEVGFIYVGVGRK